MSLVGVPELLLYYAKPISTSTAAATLDASGEKVGLVFQAPKAGSIDRIGFRTGSAFTAGDTVDVRVESLAADGTPSGSLWAANTNGAAAVAAASTNYEASLTAAATVDRDDFVAVVIVNGSTPGNFGVALHSSGGDDVSPPYAVTNVGTWAKTSAQLPILWIRYSDGSYVYIPGVFPGPWAGSSLNSGTTPDEVGMKITVPFGCKVGGIWFASADSTAPDITAKLYNSGGSVLESVAIDGDSFGTTTSMKIHRFQFDTEVALAAGDVVRASIVATTATSLTTLRIASLASDSVATAYPHGGAAVGTERTDAGAWTDDTDRLYPVGLILTAIDDGAGGGGSPVEHAYGYIG